MLASVCEFFWDSQIRSIWRASINDRRSREMERPSTIDEVERWSVHQRSTKVRGGALVNQQSVLSEN